MEENNLNPIKVSVCVSFYNAAFFVERCLDMLCAQTMKDGLEIVMVNDGSSDNTEDLVKKFVRNHPERTFVYVYQENKSLCIARQTGLANSSGDYITFLDQDDLIDNTAYEKMYNCAKENDADMVEIQTKHGDDILSAPFKGLQDAHDVLKQYFTKGGLQSQLWMRMYRRSLFEGRSVLPQLRTNNEDMFGYPCLLYKSRNVYFLHETLHTYSIDNADSFMASLTDPRMGEKRFNSRKIALKSFRHFEDFVGNEGLQEFYSDFNEYKARYFFIFLLTYFYGKSLADKLDVVIEEGAFENESDLNAYLHKWLPNKWMLSIIYKCLGLKMAYLTMQFHKRIAGV